MTYTFKYLIFFFLSILSYASFLDTYHLSCAYDAYEAKEYQQSINQLKKIDMPSLQSQMALGNSYYKNLEYKKAIKTYQSIHSTSASIKQQLFHNMGNAYAMQGKYTKAQNVYIKALQLGEDKDASSNLKMILFLEDKDAASLGIAHPKSQDSSSSKSENQDKNKEETREEDNPSSGSGAGGETEQNKEKQGNQLQDDQSKNPHPLSSKVYELINKGYIYEKEPW